MRPIIRRHGSPGYLSCVSCARDSPDPDARRASAVFAAQLEKARDTVLAGWRGLPTGGSVIRFGGAHPHWPGYQLAVLATNASDPDKCRVRKLSAPKKPLMALSLDLGVL